LGVTVRNPFEGTIEFDRQGLPKAKRPGHGIGLSSVASTVRRFDGTLDVHTEGDVFFVGAVLYHDHRAG